MKKWLVVGMTVLLALVVYAAVGPYLTVRAIRSAVQAQDAQALSRQVDFPALRDSFKRQLADRLVRKAGPDLQSNPFAAFGLAIANTVTGAAVDAMVNPVGLASVIEGKKVWDHFDQGLSPPQVYTTPAQEPLHDARYRYESFSRFTATVRDDDGDPLVFVMTRHGLRWKLSDIRLPQ